ncbi:MAG: RNA methyltransferase substrate-binding domain-containing protein, partial [Gemmatimonadota bacterium]
MPLSRSRERLLRRISTRRGREAERMVLVEGTRVLDTAMDHGAELAFVVVDEAAADGPLREVVDRVEAEGAELVPVPAATLREFADTESPQGIIAVAREPRPSLLVPSETSRALVVDAVRDPG